MIIFKDLISNDEMFTDAFKYKTGDHFYEIEVRFESRLTRGPVFEECNPVAVGDVSDDTNPFLCETGYDLVLNQRLSEIYFPSKTDFGEYLKEYLTALEKKWKVLRYDDEEIDRAKQCFEEAIPKLLMSYDHLRFYVGQSCNPLGLLGMLEFRDEGGTEVPVMMFFKDAVYKEKV